MSTGDFLQQVPRPQASDWLDEDRYAELVRQRQSVHSLPSNDDPALTADAEAFLFHHARLLDAHNLTGWLELFADQAVYWVPSNHDTDPRQSVQVVFDDRRRLEDRIARMLSGTAWSETPPNPSSHAITNVEAWMEGDRRRVVAKIAVSVLKPNSTHAFVGLLDDVHVQERGSWRVRNRRVDLINADRHIVTVPLF